MHHSQDSGVDGSSSLGERTTTYRGVTTNNALPTDLYSNYVYRKYFPCVCRMNFFKPDAGDASCLRLLLHHIPSSDWEDIRTVNGVRCDTHNEAARHRGLVRDEQEYHLAFQEATAFSTPRELRTLLAMPWLPTSLLVCLFPLRKIRLYIISTLCSVSTAELLFPSDFHPFTRQLRIRQST